MTERDIPLFHDPLGEVLHLLKLNGTLYCRSELSAPWGIEFPAFEHSVMFHIVSAGECWLHVEGQPPVLLKEGSLALLPHGQGHRISSPGTNTSRGLFDIPVEKVSDRLEIMHYGGGGEVTGLTCGVARFDHFTGQELTRCLPSVIHTDDLAAEENEWLQSSIRLIAREAAGMGPGSETLITHLADIMIIQAIRRWLQQSSTDQQPVTAGWLTGLRDKHIGRALAAFHRRPGEDWSVQRLCAVAGMSRSVFMQKFSHLMGESAGRYITRWRMQLGREMLQQGKASITAIASDLGYASESAFSRAFRREFGVPPGQVEKNQ